MPASLSHDVVAGSFAYWTVYVRSGRSPPPEVFASVRKVSVAETEVV